MNFTFTRRPVKQLYLKYTVMFAFLAACIFGTYLLTGHTFILSKDALNQHLPLMANYRAVSVLVVEDGAGDRYFSGLFLLYNR